MSDMSKLINDLEEMKELVWNDNDWREIGYNDGINAAINLVKVYESDYEGIRPCPFCGNTNLEVVRKSEGLHYELGTGYIVRCNYLKGGCGASGGSRDTEEDAINVWNSRKI